MSSTERKASDCAGFGYKSPFYDKNGYFAYPVRIVNGTGVNSSHEEAKQAESQENSSEVAPGADGGDSET